MKAIIQFSSLAICMMLSLHSAATTILTLEYKYEYTKSFALSLEGMDNQRHTIQIKNQNNFVFFNEEVVGQIVFGKMYNLENLPKGKYTLVIENNTKVITQEIWTNERFLDIQDQYRKEIFKPTITLQTAHIDINMLYFQEGKIFILLKNEKGNVIYDDSFHTFGSLNKRLNINYLPQGKYQLDIHTNAFSVNEKFEIGEEKMLFADRF